MKKIFLHIAFILISVTGYGQTTVPIPDPAFLAFLKANYQQTINASDELIISAAAQVTSTTISCDGKGITNLEGIQYFSQVNRLLAYNNNISYLPSLVGMTNLQTLQLYNNDLSVTPDFSDMLKLKTVLIYQNNLTAFPKFNNNPALEEVIASQNAITSIQSLSNLTNLIKLDVGQNQLIALPDLSENTQLQQLICWQNQLTTLPSMKSLVNLTRLNAGKNKLMQTPDLSANTQLSILALDNNLLTSLPANIIGSPNLTSVKLYNNYFTFKDLGPYAGILTSSNIYMYTPMLSPVGDTLDAYYNQSVAVHSHVDTIVANVTYKWYEGTTNIGSGTTDAVTISQTSGNGIMERYVYAKITHPSLSSLTLTTDTFLVRFYPCPTSSDISYKATKTDCGNSGAVEVAVQGYVASGTDYALTSTSFGTTEYYNVNKMRGLIDTSYALTINFAPGCSLDYTNNVTMPAVDCKEAFITPNGDGDMDTYFIAGTGNAIIYNKDGKEVKRVALPYEWNGYGPNGLVPAGYYIVVVNGGKDKIYISVLY